MAEPTSPQAVLKRAVALRRQGRWAAALRLLRDPLRRGLLDPQQTDRTGRFIQAALREGNPCDPFVQVLILGQCTTSWLGAALTATAWGRGLPLLVSEGGYDNVLQELMATGKGGEVAQVIVLLPWSERLLHDNGQAPQRRADQQLAFWQQAWQLAIGRRRARLVQVGYDWLGPGATGFQLGAVETGNVSLIRRMNAMLRSHLPPGTYFLDLEQVAGEMGRSTFYDPRRYFWTKQPFSEAGVVRLADHLFAGVRALVTGPKKVLVVDLDNTLWGGVVGEVGPLGIELGNSPDGEAYRAFQKHLKQLSHCGRLLAVCSKNNPDDAKEPFLRNPDVVLSLSDFAAFEASWEPKAVAIQRIAGELNLGLDSFV